MSSGGGKQRAATRRQTMHVTFTWGCEGTGMVLGTCHRLSHLVIAKNPTRQLLSSSLLLLLPLYSSVNWGSKMFSNLSKIPPLGQWRSVTSEQMSLQFLRWPPRGDPQWAQGGMERWFLTFLLIMPSHIVNTLLVNFCCVCVFCFFFYYKHVFLP